MFDCIQTLIVTLKQLVGLGGAGVEPNVLLLRMTFIATVVPIVTNIHIGHTSEVVVQNPLQFLKGGWIVKRLFFEPSFPIALKALELHLQLFLSQLKHSKQERVLDGIDGN